MAAVLCAQFQNYSSTKKYSWDKRAFERFQFKAAIGQIIYIYHYGRMAPGDGQLIIACIV